MSVPELDATQTAALEQIERNRWAKKVLFGIGSRREMTQEWADFLYLIACDARALAHEPTHADQEKILAATRSVFAEAEARGMTVPEAAFTWRLDEWKPGYKKP